MPSLRCFLATAGNRLREGRETSWPFPRLLSVAFSTFSPGSLSLIGLGGSERKRTISQVPKVELGFFRGLLLVVGTNGCTLIEQSFVARNECILKDCFKDEGVSLMDGRINNLLKGCGMGKRTRVHALQAEDPGSIPSTT